MEGIEEQISEVEARTIEMTQSEPQRENRLRGGKTDTKMNSASGKRGERKQQWKSNGFFEKQKQPHHTQYGTDYLNSLITIKDVEFLNNRSPKEISRLRVSLENVTQRLRKKKITSILHDLCQKRVLLNSFYEATIILMSVGDLRNWGDDQRKR